MPVCAPGGVGMHGLSLEEIKVICGGVMSGTNCFPNNVSIDSRTMQKGELFVALKGSNFDGHDYVADCAARGCCAAIVSRPCAVALPMVLVPDTLSALGKLAAAWRERFVLKVLALTGSNGKTTTKEMLASILRVLGNVLTNHGNFNNHIGVPLTLLGLREKHRFAVIEMGASRRGDIRELCALAKPDASLVTNAAPAHLLEFGTLEGVAAGKGEIFESLPDNGIGAINRDDRFCSFWQQLLGKRRQITFSMKQEAEVRADTTAFRESGNFYLTIGKEKRAVHLQLKGDHNVQNALAASALGHAAGADIDAIVQGLEATAPLPGRLFFLPGPRGMRLIDDCYNANPGSLLAGLQVLSECEGERWLALADMVELGDAAVYWHEQCGHEAKRHQVKRLFACGSHAQKAAVSFGQGGECFSSFADMSKAMKVLAHPGVTLLVKGSRSSHAEKLIAELTHGGHEGC